MGKKNSVIKKDRKRYLQPEMISGQILTLSNVLSCVLESGQWLSFRKEGMRKS